MSHLTLPGRDPAEEHELLERLLVPSLVGSATRTESEPTP